MYLKRNFFDVVVVDVVVGLSDEVKLSLQQIQLFAWYIPSSFLVLRSTLWLVGTYPEYVRPRTACLRCVLFWLCMYQRHLLPQPPELAAWKKFRWNFFGSGPPFYVRTYVCMYLEPPPATLRPFTAAASAVAAAEQRKA